MLRTLFKDSAIYAAGTIASRIVGFIMIPVYTRVLTPADYGIIETIVRLVDIIGLFLAMGLAESLLRHYYLAEGEQDRRLLVSTVFTLNMLVLAIGAVLTLPVAPWLAQLAFGHDRYSHYVMVSLLAMLVGNLIELPMTLWRAEGKAWRFTSISLSKLTTQLAANIVLVVWLRLGVWGVVWSGLINAVLWSTILALGVRRRYGLAFDWRWAKPVMQYGVPLVPAALSQFMLHYSDRFFLTRYATESELGLYSLAYRFGMLVSVLFGPLSQAWWPWVFRTAQEADNAHQLRKGSALLFLVGAVLCTGVVLGAPPVIRLVTAPSFWAASRFVPLLAMSYWFFIASSALRIGSLVGNRTATFALANVFSAFVCFALNAWLIPRYSTWGAVYATLLSLVVFSVAIWVGAQRVNPLPHDFVAAALSVLVMIGAGWMSTALHLPLILDLPVRFALWLMLSSLLLVYFVREYRVSVRPVRVLVGG